MEGLSARKERILEAVIIEYVDAAEPVPSDLIVRKYGLGVKSATIRNELAEISELGLLAQPHSSSGRVPSDKGYRYYVDRIVVAAPLNAPGRQIIEGAASDEDSLHDVLAETTKAVSRMTHLLTAASLVRNASITVRSLLLTALGPGKGLLVLVLSNGHVENRFLDLPHSTTLNHVGEANASLFRELGGRTLKDLSTAKAPASDDPVVTRMLRDAIQSLRSAAKELMQGKLITDGEEYVFAQPEFARDQAAMLEVLDSLEDEEKLKEAVEGTGITIGQENIFAGMRCLTIVRRSFTAGGTHAGTIAVLGPTRLHYERTIAILDFAATALSHTLDDLAG